jgi:uncharacterized protein (TIGR04206 family)
MSDGIASEVGTILVGETRTLAISFDGLLDSLTEEKLTGTPTFAQYEWNNGTGAWDVSTDLTISSAAVSTAVVRLGVDDVRLGAAVLALVAGAVAATQYRIVCDCGTTSNPAQTVRGVVLLNGVGVV